MSYIGPKLIQHSIQKCPNTGRKIEIVGWSNPKNWTQEEVNICTKYYQLQAKKLGVSIDRYMKEFQI